MKNYYSIIVIGAGYAGSAAAIAAAKEGAEVLLIDEGNCAGGAAANALITPYMPYFTFKDGERIILSAGIFKEITDGIASLAKEFDGENADFSKPIQTHNEEYMKIVLNRMFRKYGVKVIYHAKAVSVNKNGNRIDSVDISAVDGIHRLKAGYYIDATGNADIAYLAGFPTHLGRECDSQCQPMTLCFRVGYIDTKAFFENKAEWQRKYKEYQSRGEITNPRENILVFRTTDPNILHFNTTRVIKKSPTNPDDLTEAEFIAREQVYEMFSFLKKEAKGCENAVLISTALTIGIRESRMIDGEYTLTAEDLMSFTKFPDGICACNYDIDIHSPDGSGTSHWYFPQGEYYTIPYRCLIPKESENLLVAGRCISSTHDAQASYRIMPTVCNIGQAAGTAAALCEKHDCNVAELDTDTLRKRLISCGAFL